MRRIPAGAECIGVSWLRVNWRLPALLAPLVVAVLVGASVYLVTWVRGTPTAMLVPGSATAVTVSRYGPEPGPGQSPVWPPDGTRTVTDPKQMATITADVNGPPLFPKGTISCPMDDGSHYLVQFSYSDSDRRTLFVQRGGCQGVGFASHPDRSLAWSLADHRLLDDLDALFR